MNKVLTVMAGLSLLLASCQKEINIDLGSNSSGGGSGSGGSGGGSSNGNLLTKIVAVTGTETVTTLYTYDSQQRLSTLTTSGTSGGQSFTNYNRYEWDAPGRIKRIVQKSTYQGIPSDTVFNVIHYPNATSFDCDYSVNTISFSGITTNDSAVYTYTGGKLSSILHYLSVPFIGGYDVNTRNDFTYDASGKVSSYKMFSVGSTPGGPLSPISNSSFLYASNQDALLYSTSATQNYLFAGLPNTTNLALTKLQLDDLTTPSNSRISTFTYTLNSSNRPATSVETRIGGGPTVITNSTYYYQ